MSELNTLPYRVLAVYKPTQWISRLVGRDLTDITQEAGFKPHYDPAHGPLSLKGRNWVSTLLHAEVRRRTFKTTQGEDWHYDADLPDSRTGKMGDPNCLICVWASNTPTLIRLRSGSQIYQPKPYELVVFSNMACVHRRPTSPPRVRWVFRQRLAPRGLWTP